MCNSAESEISTTIIRRCGTSYGSCKSLWGKNSTLFDVNDKDNDGGGDDDDDDDDSKKKPANANYVNILVTSYRRTQCRQNGQFTYKAPRYNVC
jgi:hypothetical protein